ncbi:MAG: ABC transporter ATP-binding protein [Verrucomicrobiota bacterium]
MTAARTTTEHQDPEIVHERPLSMSLVVRIFGTLGKHGWVVAASTTMMVICVITDMMMVRQIRSLVDRTDLLETSPAVLLGPLALIALINRATGTAQWLAVSYAVNQAMLRMRKDFFAKLQSLSKHFFDTHKAGWLVARSTGDMGLIMEFMRFSLVLGVMVCVSIVFAAREIAEISWILLIPSAVLAPIVVVATHKYRRSMSRAQRDARQQNSRLVAELTENIRGVRIVQAFSRERRNLRRFNRINLINHNLEIRISRLNALFLPSMDFLGVVNTVVVVLAGSLMMHADIAQAWLSDPLTAGDLVAYILYSNIILWPLRMGVELYSMSLRAMAGAERIFEIMDRQPEVIDQPDAVEARDIRGDIRFEHVTFRYEPGAEDVLKDFSVHMPPGQTVAMVGETGAGKTTVASLLARFYDVSEGRILIDGRDLRQYRRESLHQSMGIVLQQGFLFSGTVLDNLRFRRPELSEDEVIAAAKRLGTHEAITKLADGYHTQVQEGGESISEGQRQLVSITRALIADPRVLILDEPTSSLDVYTEKILHRALHRLMEGRTTLMIAHRLTTVRNADLIVVLDHGHIVEQGNHEQLMSRRGHYYTMVQTSRESDQHM